jgi:hypothetical protein
MSRSRSALTIAEPLHLGLWRWAAVLALGIAYLLITVTRTIDHCQGLGDVALFVGWVAAPVVGIAATVVVSVFGESRFERIASRIVTIVLVVAWAYSIVWASVGSAIDRVAC